MEPFWFTFTKELQPYADKIADFYDADYDSNDGYYVTLMPGWKSPEDEDKHVIHADTPDLCALRLAKIEPCDCPVCVQAKP